MLSYPAYENRIGSNFARMLHPQTLHIKMPLYSTMENLNGVDVSLTLDLTANMPQGLSAKDYSVLANKCIAVRGGGLTTKVVAQIRYVRK